ncbi:hypothetical protein B0H10DRAFT_2277329 [Mycena sp. CBHHK59/15]|nr:hypothetical protein B0H10DRAFT_2277329 [Mycena sp. CBHHK59/15]
MCTVRTSSTSKYQKETSQEACLDPELWRPENSKEIGTENDENVLPVTVEKVRPCPKPEYRNRDSTVDEEAAAAALLSMGAKAAARLRPLMDCVFDSVMNFPGDVDYSAEEVSEETQGQDREDEDEEEDGSGGYHSEVEEEQSITIDLDAALDSIVPLKSRTKFAIPFEVPYKNAKRDLAGITSHTTFDDFLLAAAARMDTPGVWVRAYLASYKPRNPKPTPKLLEDNKAWDSLIMDVEQYIGSCKAKNRGTGSVKPFHISLVDVSGDPSHMDGKKAKKGESEDQPQAVPALKEHELFKNSKINISAKNAERPVSSWIVSRHQAILTEPPKELNLDINHSQQQKAKNARAHASAMGSSEPPMWVQHLAPVFGALLGNRVQPPSQEYIQNMPGQVPRPLPADPTLDRRNGTKHIPKDVPIPDLCPDIASWLEKLDSDPVRGRMNLNYTQYKKSLINQGFFELSDMANVTAEKLLSLLGRDGSDGLSFGIANRLVTYAKADYQQFLLKPSKHTRVD